MQSQFLLIHLKSYKQQALLKSHKIINLSYYHFKEGSMTLCLRLKIYLSMRSINSPGKRKSILKFKKIYCKYLNLNALKTS